MNLANLFELQAALDTHIEHEHPRQKGENRLEQKVLALLVELGELAQEWRGFKFWSNDQQPRQKELIEEYVDCLHFILSIGNEIDCKIKTTYVDLDMLNIPIVENFIKVNKYAIDVLNVPNFATREAYHNLFIHFLNLGMLLDLTYEQIENAYNSKNEINHQRQLSGY